MLSAHRTPYRRLLCTFSALDSGLPYNWNWQRPWLEVADFLQAHPIVLMDAGARGLAPPELDSLGHHVRRVGFEADPEECRRLNEAGAGRFFPTLLAGAPGTQTINLYRERSYSSVLPLSERFQRLWSGPVPLDAALELDATSIDTFVGEHPDLSPDILKLDTQGSELEILRGGVQTLQRVGLVEVEVEFTPLYDGQPLFGDVASFMAGHGFELLYLSRVMATRGRVYEGPSRGQLLYADALFAKTEDDVGALTVEQLAKYLILLCQYGHLDVAWQLLEASPAVDRVVPGLRTAFGAPRSRPVRAALMQLDKVLAVALHLRRCNQRGADSDRSWPIR